MGGSSAITHASYIGSWMKQKDPRLTVEDIVQANGILKETKQMSASITFRPPPISIYRVVITSFSDAAFNVTQSPIYGQTGIVNGIRYVTKVEEHDIYHIIDWASMRQRRVCHSSYGAGYLGIHRG